MVNVHEKVNTFFTLFQGADESISQCQGDLDSPRQPRSLAPISFGLNILSGGQLLKIGLLDNHLLDTFGRKSTARHKIYQLLESS
jgi:hypothetical protein